jgi:hypothetical protein
MSEVDFSELKAVQQIEDGGLEDQDTAPLPAWFEMPNDWRDEILGMYEAGATNEEVIAWIAKVRKGKFNNNMFYRWARNVPQFKFVVNLGGLYKKAWWLRQGRINIHDGKFNTPLYIRMMTNLFAWRTDSSVIESVGDKIDLSTLTEDELQLYRKLREKMKQVQEQDGNGIGKRVGNGMERQSPKCKPRFAGTGRD